MEITASLKESVMAHLRQYALTGALQNVALVTEFSPRTRDIPLKKPVVAVGVESVALQEGGFGGYFGEASGGAAALYGQSAVVTLYFDIHCPLAFGGVSCLSIYEAFCDALLLEGGTFGLSRMWCGPTAYDKDSGGNRLRARAALRGAVTRQDRSLRVREFEVRSDERDGIL